MKCSSKFNIVHVVPHAPPFVGGLEHFVWDIARHQAKTHQVTIVALNHDPSLPDKETKDGVLILRTSSFSVIKHKYRWPFLGLQKTIKDQRPHIIFTHTRFFPTSLLGGRLARNQNLPWIHIEHGQGPVQAQNKIIALFARVWDITFGTWIFRHADHLVALSSEGQKFIRRFHPPQPISVIENGVILPEPVYRLPRKKKALFFGRLIPEKGVGEILEVAQWCPDWSFELVGEGSFVFGEKIPDNVTVRPSVSRAKIQQKIHQSDLVLLPSWAEGHSLAVLEAAACARPLLVTDVGNNADIVGPDFLVPMRDVPALRHKMCSLADDWEALEAEGLKNRKRVAQRAGFDRMVSQYDALIASLLRNAQDADSA